MFCIHSGFLIRKIAPKTNNIQQMEAKANQLGWMSQFSNLFLKKKYESTYYSEIYEKTKL